MQQRFGDLAVGTKFRFPPDFQRDDIEPDATYTVVQVKEGVGQEARRSMSSPRVGVPNHQEVIVVE